MTRKNWKSLAFLIVILGSIQFIILTFIAMFFYKGGTYIDPSTSQYIFWYNYFSDLGQYISHSGISNRISFILFTITLTLWGLSQIPFFITFPYFFKNSKKLKSLSIVGSIFGILMGVFYVGIAFTPSDLMDNLHNFFAFFGFGSGFICIILYSAVIYQDLKYPNFYAKIFVISAIILSLYFITLGLIQNINIAMRLFLSVTGQKIMIYCLLICGIIQGYGALKQLKC